MPDSTDCHCGRSQVFTLFDAKESITVDRATLERVLFLLKSCSANREYLCGNDIFVVAAKTYLASLDNGESRKALNLLRVWTDIWPDATEELQESLDEALDSLNFILAASRLGGGHE
jgi:hypothetical protein